MATPTLKRESQSIFKNIITVVNRQSVVDGIARGEAFQVIQVTREEIGKPG